MTPIEKNIVVVDEFGNEYEATYPQRAKGLVKNGRARFIDENTICLACPPNNELEDNDMSENKKVDSINNANTSQNSGTSKEVAENMSNLLNQEAEQQYSEKLTMNYVLEQIEKIQVQTDHIGMALAALGNMIPANSGSVPDVAGAEQAEAIAEVVESREVTNQKLIALYEKMYDDLTSKKTSLKELALRALDRAADDEGKIAAVSDVLDTIRHLG